LIRTLVAMFSNDHHDRSLHIPINRVVYDLRKVLESVFPEHQLARPYGSSLSGRKARYDDLATVDSRLTAIGCLDWYECVVGTDSSKLKFKGPRLFENLHYSAALAHCSDGSTERAIAEFRKGLMTAMERSGKQIWKSLAEVYYRVDKNYAAAKSVFEEALSERPSWFRQDVGFWTLWYDMYEVNNDLEGAIKRFMEAVSKREGICWGLLCRAHTASGCDGEYTRTVLKRLIESSVEELGAADWESIGHGYCYHLDMPDLASECYERSLLRKSPGFRSIWKCLVRMYVKSREDPNSVPEEYDFWKIYSLLNYVDLCHKYGGGSEAVRALGWADKCDAPFLRLSSKERVFLWKLRAAAYALQGNRNKMESTYRDGIAKGNQI